MPAVSATAFATVARQVALRVALRRWLGWLGRTLLPICIVLGCLSAISLLTESRLVSVIRWIVLTLWLVGPLLQALWKQPGTYSVLALWDQAAGRREAFASAWWFEQQPERTKAQQAHLDTQLHLLPEARVHLSRDLPLRPHRWLWLPPVIVLVGSLIQTTLLPATEDFTVDEAMARAVHQEAQKLANTDWAGKKLDGLQPEERQALETLKESLQQTAEAMEQAAGKDARDVMSELERRAREAEKLAERLAADQDTWASDALIAALRQHADTADLGDAVAAKNANQTAQAAEALAQQLTSPQLAPDTQERLNETFQDSESQAEREDKSRTVGQHVLNAAAQLEQKKPSEAGTEMSKLADKMRDQSRREQAQKELEKLAQQLRDAGSSLTSQKEAGSMQKMAEAAAPKTPQSKTGGQTPQVGQAQAPSPGQQGQSSPQLQPPGLGQMSQGQQPMMQQSPESGSGQSAPMMMAQQPGAQGQSPKEGQPMLFAPIPGQKPGDKPEALLLGPPGENPGDGPMIGAITAGGKDPGAGKADLKADATPTQKIGQQRVVTAQQTQEGQSSVRSIEGSARPENALRSASEIASEALAAEEAALDQAALPPSRREQVRRYFTELRKRFEKP